MGTLGVDSSAELMLQISRENEAARAATRAAQEGQTQASTAAQFADAVKNVQVGAAANIVTATSVSGVTIATPQSTNATPAATASTNNAVPAQVPENLRNYPQHIQAHFLLQPQQAAAAAGPSPDRYDNGDLSNKAKVTVPIANAQIQADYKLDQKLQQNFEHYDDAKAKARQVGSDPYSQGAAVVSEGDGFAVYKLSGFGAITSQDLIAGGKPNANQPNDISASAQRNNTDIKAIATHDGHIAEFTANGAKFDLTGAYDGNLAGTMLDVHGNGLPNLSADQKWNAAKQVAENTALQATATSEQLGVNTKEQLDAQAGKFKSEETRDRFLGASAELKVAYDNLNSNGAALEKAQAERDHLLDLLKVDPNNNCPNCHNGKPPEALANEMRQHPNLRAEYHAKAEEVSKLRAERDVLKTKPLEIAKKWDAQMLLRVSPQKMTEYGDTSKSVADREKALVKHLNKDAQTLIDDSRTTRENILTGKFDVTKTSLMSAAARDLHLTEKDQQAIQSRIDFNAKVELAQEIGLAVIGTGLLFVPGGQLIGMAMNAQATWKHFDDKSTNNYAANVYADPNDLSKPLVERQGYDFWDGLMVGAVALDGVVAAKMMTKFFSGAGKLNPAGKADVVAELNKLPETHLQSLSKYLGLTGKANPEQIAARLEGMLKDAKITDFGVEFKSGKEFAELAQSNKARGMFTLEKTGEDAYKARIIIPDNLNSADVGKVIQEKLVHIEQAADPALRARMASLHPKNLVGWAGKSEAEKFELIQNKLDLEIDAQRRIMKAGGEGSEEAAAHLEALEGNLDELKAARERTGIVPEEFDHAPSLHNKASRAAFFNDLNAKYGGKPTADFKPIEDVLDSHLAHFADTAAAKAVKTDVTNYLREHADAVKAFLAEGGDVNKIFSGIGKKTGRESVTAEIRRGLRREMVELASTGTSAEKIAKFDKFYNALPQYKEKGELFQAFRSRNMPDYMKRVDNAGNAAFEVNGKKRINDGLIQYDGGKNVETAAGTRLEKGLYYAEDKAGTSFSDNLEKGATQMKAYFEKLKDSDKYKGVIYSFTNEKDANKAMKIIQELDDALIAEAQRLGKADLVKASEKIHVGFFENGIYKLLR